MNFPKYLDRHDVGVSAPTFCGREVRGVVLDLDGTLISTTVDFRLMKQRVVSVIAALDVPASVLDRERTTADNIERAVIYLSSSGRGDEVSGMLASMSEVMNRTEMERVSQTVQIKGAGECLERLRGAGLRTGLLTRGSRNYAIAALSHAGLDHEFNAMVCRDDFPEEEAKPNGKAMIRMAGMLSLRPEECVLVGDHAMDLSCARSASSGFIGVLSGAYGRAQWSESGCTVVIDSVTLLPDLLLEHKPYEPMR